MNMRGFPHSDIPGSKPVCGSPKLFAAYHVLHRHLSPRHSPYALSSLTIDMRTNTVAWTFACRPAVLILLGTAMCFVVGKHYGLQDIQLSRSAEAPSCQPSAASCFEDRAAVSLSRIVPAFLRPPEPL